MGEAWARESLLGREPPGPNTREKGALLSGWARGTVRFCLSQQLALPPGRLPPLPSVSPSPALGRTLCSHIHSCQAPGPAPGSSLVGPGALHRATVTGFHGWNFPPATMSRSRTGCAAHWAPWPGPPPPVPEEGAWDGPPAVTSEEAIAAGRANSCSGRGRGGRALTHGCSPITGP